MILPQTQKLLTAGICILIAILMLCILVLASVPPVSRDALTHHLAIPKLWIKHGGIHEIPDLKVSYYPMNLDLLYAIPLYYQNDIIPKYIHFAFAVATAWLIYHYLNRRLNRLYALTGALLFLSIPVIIKLSITVYVDLGLVFFSTFSILHLLRWIETGYSPKHLFLSGVACGLALGTKYNGLIVFFLLSLFVPFIYMRTGSTAEKRSQLKALGCFLVFIMSALIFFSPWMIKNWIWTGNPVYPLYDSLFYEEKDIRSNDSMEAPEAEELTWRHFNVRKYVFKESAWETATVPIRIFFQGKDDDPKYFDGKLNPFLLLLPFLFFLRIRSNGFGIVKHEMKILTSFAILFLAIVYFQTDMRARYIAPILPPLVILSMFGVVRFIAGSRKIASRYGRICLKTMAGVAVAWMFFINGQYVLTQFRWVNPLSFLSGRMGRDAYITRYRPEYAVMNYANRMIDENARILGIYLGNRAYYSDREIIFDFKLLQKSVNKTNPIEEIDHELKTKGITHLMVRYDLFNQWIERELNKNERRGLEYFFRNKAVLLFSAHGHGLYQCL